MTPPLWQKWRRTKEPLDESEREWKCWLKAQHSENVDHGIWSHHFMGNRWENSRNSVRLYFWGLKITADGDCSHEIKRRLLLGRKVMSTLGSIFKSRDITLLTKVHLVKPMVFPVIIMDVRVGPWRRLSAKKLMLSNCGLLRVSWMARRSNLSILKEINPEYSLEGLMLKLKLQYSGHLIWRAETLEKTLMLGKTEKGQQGMRCLDGIIGSMDMFEQIQGDEGQGGLVIAKSWTRLNNNKVFILALYSLSIWSWVSYLNI